MERAFTVVITRASDLEEFCRKTNKMLERYGWKLLGVKRPSPCQMTAYSVRKSKTYWEN